MQSTVDVSAPSATITAQPATPSANSTATFAFGCSEGTALFECQLTGSATADGNYTACRSPQCELLCSVM